MNEEIIYKDQSIEVAAHTLDKIIQNAAESSLKKKKTKLKANAKIKKWFDRD